MTPLSFNTSRSSYGANFEREFSRLLTAAVINQRFREMLLSDPAQALAAGFAGEAFALGGEERDQVASIHASSLEDFARQLNLIQTAFVTSLSVTSGG
jgi:hypothetical protein